MTDLRISAAFDGGNIVSISTQKADDIRLSIRPDQDSAFYQWFYFRLSGARHQACRLRLENAAGAAYPAGWDNYRARASYDRQHWFLVPTRIENGELIIEHRPEQDSVYYAYFTPYSWERHLDRLALAQQSARVRSHRLGSTLDGRDLDMLQIGSAEEGRRRIWITARQHPGETMAEWLMEGVIDRLLDESDPVATALLESAVFYLVPNMNPDGSVRGHLRTNAQGVNLNREWQTPSLARSPEVYHVMERMQGTGVDLFLDIHGDESLPYNFVAGCGANPGFTPQLERLESAFSAAFLAASPDFQTRYGYEKEQFGAETLTLASNQVGERFGCLSLTLELPFKDNADRPDKRVGWNEARSQRLGEALLIPILSVLEQLR